MKKILSLMTICILILTVFIVGSGASVQLIEHRHTKNTEIKSVSSSFDDYIDLTVEEVWDLVTDTSNGIQYLIDVRTDAEWINEHIETPYPEHARHHCKCEWEDETILQDFMDFYEGKEIILYCLSGGRSVGAANILIDNGFDGTIYNMVGGITYWKNNGYPTVPNRIPNVPQITGVQTGIPGQEYSYIITTTDPDYDDVSYYVQWGDGESSIYQDSFASGKNITFSHNYDSPGYYTIRVKARDTYFAESEWTEYPLTIALTELEINSVQNSFGAVTYQIKNTGDYTAENVTSSINISGGFMDGINIQYPDPASSEPRFSLEPEEIKGISSKNAGFLCGFGPIEIFIIASADNADQITYSQNAFVIGPLIL